MAIEGPRGAVGSPAMFRSRDHGWIEVICGPMFSGKSEELIRRLRRAQIARQRVQIFKPAVDTRFADDHIVSHSELRIPSDHAATAAELLGKVHHDTEVIGIDEVQLQRGLQVKPEFVLTLSQLMIARLRDTLSRLRAANAIAEDASGTQTRLFDAALLDYLRAELESSACMRFQAGQTILREGASGILMYVVLEGGIAVYIQKRRVERVGPGGVLGEIALIDQSPRVASAIAETDCTLLGINRITFLRILRNKPELPVPF